MRTELKKRDGLRGEFSATFQKYGRADIKIPGFGRFRKARTLAVITYLFVDVRDSTGAVVTDHLWFKQCKTWTALGLRPGDKVRFEARVKPYEKGYRGGDQFEGECGRATDYKLAFPTRARLVDAFATELPLFGSKACPACGQAMEGDKRFCERQGCAGGRMD